MALLVLLLFQNSLLVRPVQVIQQLPLREVDLRQQESSLNHHQLLTMLPLLVLFLQKKDPGSFQLLAKPSQRPLSSSQLF